MGCMRTILGEIFHETEADGDSLVLLKFANTCKVDGYKQN